MIFKVGDNFLHEFILSKDIYNGFLDTFKDKNPMHVNYNFALDHGYSDIVMHGNILNGFISYFIGELLPAKNVVILSQEIKFNNPVYLNDTLSFYGTIFEIYESVGVINFKYKFINQKNNTVAKGRIQIKKFK